jgi:hypothetical protein
VKPKLSANGSAHVIGIRSTSLKEKELRIKGIPMIASLLSSERQ